MTSDRMWPADAAPRPPIRLLLGCLIGLVVGCGQQDAPQPSGNQTTQVADPQADTSATNAQEETPPSTKPKKKKRRRRERPKRNLSEYGLFQGPMADLEPAEGVVPFELNSSLFSDYAWKSRIIKLPEGQQVKYDEGNTFQFPVGTIIAKTFYFPTDFNDPEKGRRLIETRLLLHRESGWIGVPYLWNEEQTDAVSEVAGAVAEVSWIHYDGSSRSNTYVIPNMNDCKRCHKNEFNEPIGPRARHLNRDYDYPHGPENQLAYWTRTGILTGAPEPSEAPELAVWDDEKSGTIDERARAWLEINCAHCHNSRGPARNSGLYLMASMTDPYKLGVFKTPVAAGRGSGGRSYDIVPGKPDESIMMFRLASTHPGIAMPEFGRTLVQEEANALIRRWIEKMEVPEGFDVDNAIGEFQSLTKEQLQQFAKEVVEQGNSARGEEILHRRRLNCFRCHAVGGIGERVGPDLRELREEKTLEYLIEAVLLPNKFMRKGFETVTVLTDSGQAFSGVVLDESETELVLRDLTRPEIRIPKDTIEDRARGNSLMPTNVISMLTRQDVVDLISFLTELSQPAAASATTEPLIRRWQILDPVPRNITKIDPYKFIADSAARRDLTWEPAYSRLTGELPLDKTITAPQSGRRIVRAEINVVKSGNLHIELNSTDGLRMCLDGVPIETARNISLNVEAGTRLLAFMIDLDERDDKTLRCKIGPAADSPAEVRLAGELRGTTAH